MRTHRFMQWLKKIFYFPGFDQAKKKNFYFNILIGIIFAVLLTLLIDKTKWGEDNLNNIFDSFFIKKEAGIMVNRPAPRDIVFIEIDEETYRRWGEPLIVPRSEVARAIDAAYRGGAKIIYPDILFDHRSSQKEDNILRSLLEKISSDNNNLKIIFPVTVGSNGNRKGNIFDKLIDRESNFYRAVPGVVSSSIYETTVRYWRGYEDIWIKNKEDILWGVPLLTSILARGNIKKLDSFKGDILAGSGATKQLQLNNGHSIRLSTRKEDLYFQRIRFTIFPENVLDAKREGNLNLKNVIRFSELEFFAGEREIFQDKIVIIGNTSPDAGDIHVTPAGQMAGMYVVGNAVNTLIAGKQTAEAPAVLNLVFFIIIIAITAYFFVYFHSFLANVLGTLILSYIFIRIIGFYFYFHYGIFLSSVMLIVLIGFYEVIDDVREVAVDLNETWKEIKK